MCKFSLWLMLYKNESMNLTDYKQFDFRISSLKMIISGLENSIYELKKKLNETEWYDAIWLLEESEPIFGFAFVAAQNYINSSIYDRFETLEKQYKVYKNGKIINSKGRTDIELIISLANYFKHRDHPKDLIGETYNILNDFNLQFGKDIDISNSPIFKGLELFSKNWDLKEIIKAIEIWRCQLWELEKYKE